MELTRIPSRIPAIPALLHRLFNGWKENLTQFRYVYYCLFLFHIVSFTMGQPREQQTCPTRCRCVHVEGRLTADCSGARLTAIPGPLPSGAMIVRFDNNPIDDSKWLQQGQYFVRVDRFAVDWTELSLRSCNISRFRPELFWGLPNLNRLLLSGNKLTKIPTSPESQDSSSQEIVTPFRDMAKLRVLDLSRNQLTTLVRKNFYGAVSLEDIDLSYNEIKFLHNDAFSGLPKLRTIDLTRNKLNLVTRSSFARLPHLKQLQLSLNPFDCDCRLKDFVDWQRDKYIVQPPKCAFPEKLRDKPWNHLKLDEFACVPKLTPGSSGKKAVVNVGLSITLQCKVSGVPEPRMIWEFHNATQTVIIQSTPGKYDLTKTAVQGCQYYESSTSTSLPASCSWLHSMRIVKVGPSDVGVYHCKATNPADTQYLVFQLDLDRGQIVHQMTGNGFTRSESASNTQASGKIANQMDDASVGDDGATASVPAEKAHEAPSSGDLLLISLILGATVVVIIALLLAVLCYRRAVNKHRLTGHSRANSAGPASGGGSSFKPKSVNGYGYHIIDNGGVGAVSPASVATGDASACTTLRSPTSPAIISGAAAINPVEKPPRTHTENFYSETSAICDFHRRQMEQQRRHILQAQQRHLDDSRTGLIHAEAAQDDSGFSDPESYFQQQQHRSATLPSQRNQQAQQLANKAGTPGQRVLRPAIDDPLLEKKLLLTRRNSDGGSGCCAGHAHSAVAGDQDRRTLSSFAANPYDKTELRETAL